MRTTLFDRSRIFLVALVFPLMLGACQSTGQGALPASHAMQELSPQASQAIAQDMAARLSEHVPPGSAEIMLKPDASSFGSALQTALTGAGYAVATDASPSNGTTLAYVIEEFDGQVLARLATKDIDLGRTYTLTTSGAAPASPLSIKQRG